MRNYGFGLLAIVIVIAIVLVIVAGRLYNKNSGEDDGKKESVIEIGIDAIDEAQNIKDSLEKRPMDQ